MRDTYPSKCVNPISEVSDEIKRTVSIPVLARQFFPEWSQKHFASHRSEKKRNRPFVRSPKKIGEAHERLKVMEGDVFNAGEMTGFVEGHDAVLSSFGPNALLSSTIRRDFGRALAAAMRESGVHRLELVSSALLFREAGILPGILKVTLFRQMLPDTAGMEAEVCQSDLDWTMVRPPRLTNGAARHSYRIADGSLPKDGFLISRADVAHFMIGEAENPTHVQRIVGVANKLLTSWPARSHSLWTIQHWKFFI